MDNKWSQSQSKKFVKEHAGECGKDLALRTYTSQLLGAENALVLHGGGNTSVKTTHKNVFGRETPAIFIKASGMDMATIEPDGHPGLDLDYLLKLRAVETLTDEAMVNEFRTHLFNYRSPNPSIETLVHAFIPKKFIDHTHADSVLALTNQVDGEKVVKAALGNDVIVLPYVKAGFKLAKAAADAFDANPNAQGMVLMNHGLMTWGDTAEESYGKMIELVTRAEDYIAKHAKAPLKAAVSTSIEDAEARLTSVAPILRGLLATRNADGEVEARMILLPLINREALDFVDSNRGKELALTAPLTPDHLIRTKVLPMWVDSLVYDDPAKLKEQLAVAVGSYEAEYRAYVARHAFDIPEGVEPFDPLPRVIMIPGLGVICAGRDAVAAGIARDITAQAISVKTKVAAMGSYQGLSETQLFSMEYYTLQHAKLAGKPEPSLRDRVAIVTGAAGAIGSGICRGLLQEGCHVVVTDLAGDPLNNLTAELSESFPNRVIGVPMDVTDPESVKSAVETAVRTWGGVDIAIPNAGIAMVCSLAEMDVDAFRRLERINIEGTLLTLRQMARHFALQGSGGDIIVVSTKNVFAPGAKFGAYSATKAASHQLARIASLEMADMGVRVNMVAPDAVFSDGARKSGLWQEVGPDRMKARGLDEQGLEDYYKSRNLLKSRVTAVHVANAVIFFATRQTPTTGATIPVDGGLPDATPR